MGKVDTGILGEIRKRVGPVVGRKWRNLNIIAKYQGNVRNPKTDAQQIVRIKFSVLAKLAASLANALNIGFSVVTKGTKVPPRSKFIKENYGNVAVVSPDTPPTVSYVDLVLAMGSLPAVDCETPDFTQALVIKVEQNDTSSVMGASADDKVFLVAYNPEDAQALMSEPYSRTEPALELTVPASWNGKTVYVWVLAYNDHDDLDIESVMRSIYLGSGTIS